MPTNVPANESAPTGAAPKRIRHLLVRPMVDAVAAWLLFGLVTCMAASGPSTAAPSPAGFAGLEQVSKSSAVEAVATSSEPAGVERIAAAPGATPQDIASPHPSAGVQWALLGLAFSFLAALNLSVFRHLRRAYASPRRRSGERR